MPERDELALLIVDVQNDYWLPPREPRPQFLRTAVDLLEFARERDVTVAHIQQASLKAHGRFQAGTLGFDIREELTPEEGELRIVKHTPGSFYETDLDELLRARGVTRVAICGMQTQKCCDTTTRDASARGYDCFFVSDAVETFDLVGPTGEVVPRDEIARATFATLHNGFARVLTFEELRHEV